MEQRRIAEILNTHDATIGQSEVLIAKLNRVKAGLLQDLFTYGLDNCGRPRNPSTHPEIFKNSCVGVMPHDWEELKLGGLLVSRPANGYSPKEANEWTGTIMLGLGCLTSNGFYPRHLKNAPRRDHRLRHALLRQVKS